jgi:hypothetical protein
MRQLDLQYCNVLLGSTEPVSGQPGILSSCKQLTSLKLSGCKHPDCKVEPARDGADSSQYHYGFKTESHKESLAALTGLSGLQHLSLRPWNRAVVPEGLFLQLSNLTSLQLSGCHDDISCAHLQHLTALNNLQDLALRDAGGKVWAQQDHPLGDTRQHFSKDTLWEAHWLGKLTTLTALSLSNSLKRMVLEPAVLSDQK